MELASGSSQTLVLAKLIRALRQQKGLTAEALAAGNFSEQYVLALERGAVRPSVPALEALAHLLDAPVSELLAAPSEPSGKLDIQALQEDIVYQTNVAKMLIRSGKVTEAMQLINEIDVYCQPYNESLPASVAYLVPFLRGRAHLQRVAPDLAQPELEAALAIAGGEPEPAARIRNLLGVVYFEMSQPRLALEQHLKCLLSIRTHVVSDINFRVNVYRNVAGDYWALNEPRQALGIYREIMPISR